MGSCGGWQRAQRSLRRRGLGNNSHFILARQTSSLHRAVSGWLKTPQTQPQVPLTTLPKTSCFLTPRTLPQQIPRQVEQRLWRRPANSILCFQGTYQDNRARLFHSTSQSLTLEVTMIKYAALQRAPSRYCLLMQQDVLQTDFFVISWVESPSTSVAFIFWCF